MAFITEKIRNLAIAGHGGTGKTTLNEGLLATAGAIPRAENIASGKTVSDHSAEEIERKISVHASTSCLEWQEHKINLIDIPGASDFVGEVVTGFRTAETACLVVAADAGVQIETIKMWRRLEARKMPRLIYVNKMDKDRADFDKALDSLKEQFKANFVPVNLPMGSGGDFKGLIGLVNNLAYTAGDNDEKTGEIPAEFAEAAEQARSLLIEAAAEGDDELMEKYFSQGTLTEDDLKTGLQEAFQAQVFVPVFCGAAEQGIGLASLLNFLVTVCPSPLNIAEAVKNAEGEESVKPINSDQETALLVYKTSIDQFSGKLSYFKVMAGQLKADNDMFNIQSRKKERLGKLYVSVGKKLTETKELNAGDLGIAAKLDSVRTNDTLAPGERSSAYIPLRLPQPVHAVAVSAASKKDEDKMNEFLHRAAEEDRTFQIVYNKETKETVIAGMGELHIGMILEKIKDKQKIEVETRTPKVAYRETITKSAKAEHTHKKQSGGHGQYGRVNIEIAPLARGEFFKFENMIRGQAVSKGYMPGIEKGLLEAMEEGFIAHYPLVDIGAKVVDGKEHPVDSSEMAFKLAGKGALKAAVAQASPVLLEPIMNLQVFTEETYVGDILSDMSAKRGRVQGQNPLGGGITEIDAQVPQAELLHYSIDLRSITSGTASFAVEFDHYAPISGKVANAVISARQSKE